MWVRVVVMILVVSFMICIKLLYIDFVMLNINVRVVVFGGTFFWGVINFGYIVMINIKII